VLDKQTKNDALELDDAKKEISRLEEALKTTGKQNTGYRLLGELKAAKLRDAEERLTELEIYGQIETPREVARLLFKSLIPVPEQKVNLQLKQAVRDNIEKLLDVETPISGADLSKSLLQAFEAFTHTLAHLNKKAKDTIASTRLRLTRTTDMIDKLQGSTYGHISTLLTKSIWQILQKEIERLKLAAIQKKQADNAHLNHSYSGEEPEIDPSELYPSENMPYLNQAVFPDPKAYTPSVALQDLPLLDDLPSRDNTALVDKILTNKKIIDTLIKAIEGKLAEITAFPKSGPKKAYRINRTLIGRSVDSRDKSVSGTYDDRVLSRDPSQIGDSSSNRYNNSSSTRRPGDSVATPGHYDIYLKDLPMTTAGTFNPTPNLSLDMTNILPQIDAFDKKVLITPPDGTTSRTNRPAILRDAKTLSTKFNRIIRDDESISDGVYLLVDSELKKRKKKQKAIK
jgi:hypothetical protein